MSYPDISKGIWFVPCTPAGTACIWIAARTREVAIKNLLKDAAHMPYGTWENFEARGYTIEKWDTGLSVED